MRRLLVLPALLLSVTACGATQAADEISVEPSPSMATDTPGPDDIVAEELQAEAEIVQSEPTLPPLPKGYPRVVKLSELPDPVRNSYEMSGADRAVALAPGVWMEMQPGTTMEDALATDVLDGWCSSVKAFERKYLNGQEMAGTCW